MVEVNHRGRQMRIIGRRAPHAGATVVLTLDTQLQSLIEQSFGTRPGACVVLDPSTGEVLAIASLPTFTPESFVVSPVLVSLTVPVSSTCDVVSLVELLPEWSDVEPGLPEVPRSPVKQARIKERSMIASAV